MAGAVSFVNFGGTGNVMTQFISPTRAYSMTRDNMQIIIWNPEEMTVTGSIDTGTALDPSYPSFDYGEPVLFGDYVAWPILWYDYDNFDFKPSVDVILANAATDAPAFALSDARCGGGWSLFTDPINDPAALQSPDDYWVAPMQRTLVRIDEQVSEPLAGIPNSAVFSTLNYRLDDELYMLMSEGSAGPRGDARSSLYRVTESAAELALTTTGDLWAIGRIR